MAAEASRSSASADSYIGSLISLTSKCEIRYEGVLYNINTEESSIGLKNVRSFGTEGRKKDGPQVPPSDKVYEYILFRGSDIKDLQVKSSPPVQSMPSIHNDPAIIQSHYPHPASTSANLPYSGAGSVPDISSQAVQLGFPRSTFQGGLPLYQHGGGLGPSPHNANGSGLAMPMYWQGFYGPNSGLTHVQQQPLLRLPPGLSVPPSMQQPMQYSSINASLPTGGSNLQPSNKQEISPPLQPSVSTGSLNLTPTTLPPSTLPSAQCSVITSVALPSLMPNKPTTALPTATRTSSLPLVMPLTSSLDMNALVPPISNKPRTVHSPTVPSQTTSQSLPSVIGTSSHSEVSPPSLVTPGQLLQPASNPITSYQSLQKDVEVVQVSSGEPMPPAPTEAQSPILPTPSLSDQKLVGGPLHNHHTNRGRERGRGNGILRPVTRFSEEFDFMAMNEKFKKDEVWGHLGKSKLREKNGDGRVHDEDYSQDEDDAGILKLETKPVYDKDEFFDLLSCNALDSESRHGRTKFSEQMKIDTETFGEFPRHRGGRGGHGYGRGGGRTRGSYYGRGYGYGYVGRGRGHMMSGRTA